MNVSFDVNDKCRLAVDVKDMKQAFEFLAYAGTVFGEDSCGNCESKNLRLTHRQPQGFDYYSVECKDCRYEWKFSQQFEANGGKMYPKNTEWVPPYSGDGDTGASDSGSRSNTEAETQQVAAEPAF